MSIVLQEPLRGLFYAPYYAALEFGAFAEEGVEVRLVSSPNPGASAVGILGGAADVGWGGPMRVNQTYAREPGCDIVCFAEVVTRDPFLIIGRMPRPHFTLGDLASQRLATVSEVPTPWLCLQQDLRDAGVDPAAVARVADRSMAENMAALGRGDVYAVQLFQPFAETLIEEGSGHLWYAAANRGPTSYTCFYARRGTLESRRDELLRMVRAIHRTLLWVYGTTAMRLADVVRPYFPDVPVPRLASALERYKALGIWGRDTRLPRRGYDRLRASLVSGGFVPHGVPFETAVDNTLAQQVCREQPSALVR